MMRQDSRNTVAWLSALCLCMPLAVMAAGIAVTTPQVMRPARNGYQAELLAHAYPDEYFYGVGNPTNSYVPTGVDPSNCPPGAVAKVNQSYVWGMGKSGNDIYFGTLANGNLLVGAAYLAITNSTTLYGYSEADEGMASVYGQTNSSAGLKAGGTEDWRPPQLFHYNIPARALTLLDPLLDDAGRANLMTLGGIRAGGAASTNAFNRHRMVLLAGPPIDHDGGGVGFFLFDATTTNYIGTIVKTEYNNVRRMVDINGDLYFGVQKTTNQLDGAVIRWVNNPSAPGYPFSFQEVGLLDQMGADICVHQGRLFCTTWPGYVEGTEADIISLVMDPGLAAISQHSPGLWMSPVVPAGGLTTAHRAQWQKIWSIANYEPDDIIALSLGGGALASFDGYLYFGTMQVPATGSLAFQLMYETLGGHSLPVRPRTRDKPTAPPSSNTNTVDWLNYTNALGNYYAARTNYNIETGAIANNTIRALSLFRARNFRAPVVDQGTVLSLGGDFELLYGSVQLPVFVPPANTNDYYATTNWVLTANRMGQTPSMGDAGFGNVENVYTWSMCVFDNTLFVGTYDASLPHDRSSFDAAATNNTVTYGADLYRLHSSRDSHFQPVALNGLGNICNYGFRTMASDSNGLYLGTANPRNLLPNPTNSPGAGGWELLKLTRKPSVPCDMDDDFESDATWMTTTGMTFVISSAIGAVTNFPGVAGVLPAWADYDGDGVADPAWYNPAKGIWTVWLSSRDGQKTTLLGVAASGSVPVPADFDGDGKADPALCSPANGQIKWRSTKDGKTRIISPSAPLAIPAIGDYNGDGVSEFVWYAPPNAITTGRVIRSSSTTTPKLTTQFLRRSFKGVPVPADYDGDGKTDFALHNPVTGMIRVWRSSDAVVVDYAAPSTSCLPMVGDYDGDGQADVAWYDPLFGNFTIQYSSGGTETVPVGVGTPFGTPIPTGSRPVATPAAAWYTK